VTLSYSHDIETALAQIEQAIAVIVAWAARNDVHEATMRRARTTLSRRQLWLLSQLGGCAPARMSDLADVLGVDNSTLTPQAKRLEGDGLVAREADPGDRRAVRLRLTRAGRALLSRVSLTRRSMYGELFAGWSAEQTRDAAEHLTRVARALQPADLRLSHPV
jgi:DNA-binding MarR family transcriptional regulator